MFKIYAVILLLNGGVVSMQSQTEYDTLDACNADKALVVDDLETNTAEYGIESFEVECFPTEDTNPNIGV